MEHFKPLSFIVSALIFFTAIFVHASCNNFKENDTITKHWQALHSGLWQSNTGEMGFQVQVFHEKTADFSTNYITHTFLDNKPLPLKQVIQMDTFHQLKSSTYYKDKNNIYRYYAMAGGGTFSIFDADYASFQVLNECFSKDYQQIYHWRDGPYSHPFDYNSFKTCKTCGCIAKDKRSYYVVGEQLNQAEVVAMINNPETNQQTRDALIFLQDK